MNHRRVSLASVILVVQQCPIWEFFTTPQ